MLASAQLDGRPAEYRWRPVLNAVLARAHCSSAVRNATKIRERKIWRMQSEFCTWQNSVTGQEPPKMYM